MVSTFKAVSRKPMEFAEDDGLRRDGECSRSSKGNKIALAWIGKAGTIALSKLLWVDPTAYQHIPAFKSISVGASSS
jgi:hypothetical protein